MRAYVGEADNVRERIVQSAGNRGFWESAVVVTTSDEALTKGHVPYLEARLIELASKAGRVVLDNGQFPMSERRFLPEADRANTESFTKVCHDTLQPLTDDVERTAARKLIAPCPVE